MPITWRNIDIGSNQSANQLINAGGNTITEGISQLGDIVTGINKVGAANVDARTKVNTEDAVATLAGISDSKALAAAMGTGGALNQGTLRSKDGAEIDMNKVSSLMAAKQADLAKLDTDAKIRNENLAIGEKDRIDRNKQHQDQMEIQRNSQAIQRSQLNLALQDHTRTLATQAEEKKLNDMVLSIYKNSATPAAAEAEKQQLLTNLGSNGFNLLDPGKAGTIANSAKSLFSSGPVSQEFTDTVTQLNTQHDQLVATLDNGMNKFVERYKKANGVDDTVVGLLQDKSSTLGKTSVEMASYLYGDKEISKRETDNIARQATLIEGRFTDAGITPTPALVKEVFQRSLADDGTTVFKTDSYNIDNKILRDIVNKAKVANDFISGSLGETLKANQLEFLNKKVEVNKGYDTIKRELLLKQYEQNKGASTQGADFAVAPISAYSFDQPRYEDPATKTKPIANARPMNEIEYKARAGLETINQFNRDLERRLKLAQDEKANRDAIEAAKFENNAPLKPSNYVNQLRGSM